jgi:alpha-L-rhamnosidase
VDTTTGLVTNLPGGDGDYLYGIVDWPPQMRYGYDIKTVARTTENALAVDVFTAASTLEHALGDPATAAVEAGRAGNLAAAMNAKLRGPGGVFVDGLEADGTQSPHASQQANALALAYGVDVAATVSPGAAGRYVAAHGIATGPMNGLALLRSLHVSGLDADVVRVLTDRKDPGWAHIVASGGTFTWEDWTPSDAQGDSMSHGWGSSALVAFQQDVLGVTPVFTSKIDVRATTGGPARVTGSVPTIAGPVRVTWRRTGGRLSLRLVVPPNATATVHMPGKRAVDVGAGPHAFSSNG